MCLVSKARKVDRHITGLTVQQVVGHIEQNTGAVAFWPGDNVGVVLVQALAAEKKPLQPVEYTQTACTAGQLAFSSSTVLYVHVKWLT